MKKLGNYKTTLCGAAVLVLAICLKQQWLDQETVMAASLIAVSLGFGFSKDHDVTGGTRSTNKPKDPQP